MSMEFQLLHTFQIIPKGTHTYCIAIDLCEQKTHIALPKGKQFDLTLDFISSYIKVNPVFLS